MRSFKTLFLFVVLLGSRLNDLYGQSFSKDTFSFLPTYFAVGVNTMISPLEDYRFSPTHYPASVGEYGAIPTTEFSNSEQEWGIKRFGFRVSAGIYKPILNDRTTLHLEVGAGYSRRRDNVSSWLRFTDQIDPEQGFVQPSFMQPQEVGVHYFYGSMRSRVLIDIIRNSASGPSQGLGFGILGTYLFRSSYQIKATDQRDGQTKFYSDQDLSGSDVVYNFAPEISYQVKMAEFGQRSLYADILFAYPATFFLSGNREVIRKFDVSGMINLRVVVCKTQ